MRAIFLDRDGVINENRADHVKSRDEFCFIPSALTALRWLHMAGFHAFIATNQAIINRGIVSRETIEDIHAYMIAQIELAGGHINDIRYCPHTPEEHCLCRKPQPGMLFDLAAHWQIDLSQSYFIGDAWTDIAAGRAANTRCILVRTGRGSEHLSMPIDQQRPVDYVATNLLDAMAWIFAQESITLPLWGTKPKFWSGVTHAGQAILASG